MSPNPLNLHTQTLEDAILLLFHCTDTRAHHARTVAQNGSLHTLNETALKPLRSKNIAIFPEAADESPILHGPDLLPLPSLPSASEIERLVETNIGGRNTFIFAPSRGSPEEDARATERLLNNIQTKGFDERGAVIHMQAPTFDALCAAKKKNLAWRADGMLGQSKFQMTIAPASEVFDLVYYEHYLFSTLLTGKKVWIAYPPFYSNALILQARYEQLRGTTSGEVFLAIAEKLQHGVVIVQEAGQTLVDPPFWACVVFCVQVATSAERFLATARKFVERLVSVVLYLAVVRMWPSRMKEQGELVKYVGEMTTHLDLVLKNACKPFKADGVIRELCVK